MDNNRKKLAAAENLKKAAFANKARLESLPKWYCAKCGKQEPATAHRMRNRYCSRTCMAEAYKILMLGDCNPNFSGAGTQSCEVCGIIFKNYNKRRFCGLACRDKGNSQLRTNAKKDSNHREIVEALEKGGAVVLDTSRAMFGFPDLLVWHHGAWHSFDGNKESKNVLWKEGIEQSPKKLGEGLEGRPCNGR